MTFQRNEPRIPKYYAFMPLIRNALRGNSYLRVEELKRTIKNARGWPSDMSDPFWDVRELSHLGAMRTRRDLFDDRFALAMRRIQGRR